MSEKVNAHNLHVFGEYTEKGIFVPMINPGRDDVASWGNPLADVPIDMATGFDPKLGVLGVYRLTDVYGAEFPVNGKKVKLSLDLVREQKQAEYEFFRNRPDEKIVYAFGGASGKKQAKMFNESLETITVLYRTIADLVEKYLDDDPIFMTFSGQRRTTARFFTTEVALQRCNIAYSDYLFECQVEEFVDVDETLSHILDENRSNAKLAYSEVGQIRAAMMLLSNDLGMSERAIAQKLSIKKRGQQQKVYAVARLGVAVKSLKLGDRLTMDPEYRGTDKRNIKYVEGGYVPVKVLTPGDIRSLLGQADKATPPVQEVLDSLDVKYKKNVVQKQDVIESFLEAKIEGKIDAKTSALTKSQINDLLTIESVRESYACVGDVLRAIHDGRSVWFNQLNNLEHTADSPFVMDDEPSTTDDEPSTTDDTPTEGE